MIRAKITTLLSLMLLVSFFVTSTAEAGWRREAKKMCRQEYRECRKEHSRRFCRQERRKCKRENHVSFKDDIRWIGNKLKGIVKTAVGYVDVKYGVHEEFGDYLRISIEGGAFKQLDNFFYSPEEINSYLEIVPGMDEKKKELAFIVYLDDLENHDVAEQLQTSEGRSFPKFIDGIRHESVFGRKFFARGSQEHHFYLDPAKGLVGMFIPGELGGNVIQFFNDTKNKVKLGQMIPNINSIPVNIKFKKQKVGRLSLLSDDDQGQRSGYVLLFDIERLKEVADFE
ncbi:MAG: hypothetical protein ACOCUH_03930 [Bacteriovoracia bacterium]